MQDRNYDMLQQMLSAHNGEGLEEKLKGLMNDGSIVNGWNATQVDMLSEDWVLVDPNE